MLTIRELTAADRFEEIGDIYVQSWRSAYHGIVPQGYLDKLTHDRWLSAISAEPSSSLGMFLDGRAIGTSLVCFAREPMREGYGEIVSLYLLPDYVKKGYGKKLMLAALEKLRRDGCSAVCLWALSKNVRAEGFYEHMGFRQSGRTQVEAIGGAELPLVEYCIELQ